MAKVLVSFLGTGLNNREYRKAKYRINDKEYTTSFVSAAMVEHLNVDKKIIIGTSTSMWEEYYRYFSEIEGSFDEDFYYELIEAIDNAVFNTHNDTIDKVVARLVGVDVIQINYGINEEELRGNINKILEIDNLLDDGDEVYIDVTHGFRSFPLLAQQAVNYLKQISNKKIEIKGYYYGMLDAISDLGYAPIVDLSILNNMNDLIIGASEFKNNSNGAILAGLLKEVSPNVSKKIFNFSEAISINYSHEIKKQINQLRLLDFDEVPLPERIIVKKVFVDFLNKFSGSEKNSIFQFKLAEWYFENKLHGASYVFLTESIISKVVEDLRLSDNVFDKDARDKAKKYIFKYDPNLGRIYSSVNKIRRNIAHALDSRHNTYHNDISTLGINLKKVKGILK